jgi:DNA end-binding protein Ku
MAPRPNWKGYLKLSLVSCPVALFPATSAGERVSFNQLNKETGNRIRYKKVDAETGDEVTSDSIIKGYPVDKNVYVTVDDEELDAIQIESTHTIEIDSFVPVSDIDARFYDSPYYVVPNDKVGQDAFAVIRDAMKAKGMVGVGRVVISKRERPIILEPLGKGLRGMTLRYPYEVRNEADYFADIPDIKVPGEMLKLAEHIVDTKAGAFDPADFEDHYETALVDLLKKKQTGVKITPATPKLAAAQTTNVIDLLKRSLELSEKKPKKRKAPSLVPAMPKTKKRQRA